MSWRTLRSRSGVPSWPRKYLLTTTLVAVCDQNFGTSTPFCSKTFSPFSLLITASRSSHSTVSKGSLPAWCSSARRGSGRFVAGRPSLADRLQPIQPTTCRSRLLLHRRLYHLRVLLAGWDSRGLCCSVYRHYPSCQSTTTRCCGQSLSATTRLVEIRWKCQLENRLESFTGRDEAAGDRFYRTGGRAAVEKLVSVWHACANLRAVLPLLAERASQTTTLPSSEGTHEEDCPRRGHGHDRRAADRPVHRFPRPDGDRRGHLPQADAAGLRPVPAAAPDGARRQARRGRGRPRRVREDGPRGRATTRGRRWSAPPWSLDCTPAGNENKEKLYEGISGPKGFLAQGSEFGFGKPYARGVNDETLVPGEDRFIQIVSCNTHNITTLIKTICDDGDGKEYCLHKGTFVCMRRANDISPDRQLRAGPERGQARRPGLRHPPRPRRPPRVRDAAQGLQPVLERGQAQHPVHALDLVQPGARPGHHARRGQAAAAGQPAGGGRPTSATPT